MFSDYLHKRTVSHFSTLNVNLARPGTKHKLFMMLKTEVDVLRQNYPAIEQDFYEITVAHIQRGNLIAALNYLEQLVGTQAIFEVWHKCRKHVKEYEGGK